ncbi:hypothetical protein [Nocardia sp. IFM 10818]
MNPRLTDAEFDEIAAAIHYSYEAGTYPSGLSTRARDFLGPDGGLLALLAELRAERRRTTASETSRIPRKSDLESYLRAHGWSPDAAGVGGRLWVKGTARIGVPHDPDAVLLDATLRILARAEQRSVAATIERVLHSAASSSGTGSEHGMRVPHSN